MLGGTHEVGQLLASYRDPYEPSKPIIAVPKQRYIPNRDPILQRSIAELTTGEHNTEGSARHWPQDAVRKRKLPEFLLRTPSSKAISSFLVMTCFLLSCCIVFN